MTVSPCDYMDDLNRALGIDLDTDDVEEVTDAALEEVARLKRCEAALKAKLPQMDRLLYYVSPIVDQLDWDEDGPVDKSLFVYATDASEAIKLWRGYYDNDEHDHNGLSVPVRVHEVPIMPPRSQSMAIDWGDVHTFGATETHREQI